MPTASKPSPSTPSHKPDPFLMLIHPEVHKKQALAAHESNAGTGRMYKPVESSARSLPRRLFDVFEPSSQTGEWSIMKDPDAPAPPKVTIGIIPASIEKE